jgi:uncharacterized protein (TIGR04255 family)
MRAQNPFLDPIPSEVPLERAPLVRVIAQIRFPTIALIERTEGIANFQEAIRAKYPFLQEDRGILLSAGAGPLQLAATEAPKIWRFSMKAPSAEPFDWTVSLAKDWVALETAKYTSRADFMMRLHEVASALETTLKPAAATRIGIRYIDRLREPEISNIGDLIYSDVLGVLALPVQQHVEQHALNDVMFSLKDWGLRARWGLLSAHATFDPAAIEAINERSWVLDLDASTSEQMDFNARAIVDRSRAFAERIYAFFRWSVRDEFLRRFGGSL